MKLVVERCSAEYHQAAVIDSNGQAMVVAVGRTKLAAMKKLSDDLSRLARYCERTSESLEEKIYRMSGESYERKKS